MEIIQLGNVYQFALVAPKILLLITQRCDVLKFVLNTLNITHNPTVEDV